MRTKGVICCVMLLVNFEKKHYVNVVIHIQALTFEMELLISYFLVYLVRSSINDVVDKLGQFNLS